MKTIIPKPDVSQAFCVTLRSLRLAIAIGLLWSGMFPSTASAEIPVGAVTLDRPVRFSSDLAPILRAKCQACHRQGLTEGELNLESVPALLKGGGSGPAAIPGKPDESLILLLAAHREEPVMPPPENSAKAAPWTSAELGLLHQWITEGAQADDAATLNDVAWRAIPATFGPIERVALSPDEQLIAVGRANQLWLFDLIHQRGVQLTDSVSASGDVAPAHRDVVQSLAFSPDGTWLASGGFQEVKLWRPSDVPPVWEATLPERARSIAVNAALNQCACMTDDHHVIVFDTQSGAERRRFEFDGELAGLAYAPDGKRLLLAERSGVLHIHTGETGESLASRRWPQGLTAATWADDASVVLAVGGGMLERWSLTSLNEDGKAEWSIVAGSATSLAVSADGGSLLSGDEGGAVVLRSAHSGEVVWTHSLAARVAEVKFAHNPPACWAVDGAGILVSWTMAGAEQLRCGGNQMVAREQLTAEQSLHHATQRREHSTASLEASQKDVAERRTAHEAAENAFKMAEAELAEAQATAEKPVADAAPGDSPAPTDPGMQAQERLEAARRAEQLAQRALQLTIAEQDDLEHAARQHEQEHSQAQTRVDAAKNLPLSISTTGFSLSTDGRIAITGGDHSAAQFWWLTPLTSLADDAATAGRIQHHAARTVWKGLSVSAVAILPDDEALVLVDSGRRLQRRSLRERWDLVAVLGSETSAPSSATAPLLRDRVSALAFSPDGRILAAGAGEPSRGGEIVLFDLETRLPLQHWDTAHSDSVLDLRFRWDGEVLLSGGADKLARLFSVADGELLRTLEGHTDHVLGVDWAPSGLQLATASADKSIKLWNADTGQQIRTIDGGGKQVTSVQFTANGDQLYSTTGEARAQLHDAGSGKSIRKFPAAKDYLQSGMAARDGALACGGGIAGKLWVWNGKTGTRLVEWDSSATPVK